MRAPDYFEPTVGWRAWLVVQTPDGLRLSSVLYPTLWAPRSAEVAKCSPVELPEYLGRERSPRKPPPHAAPDLRCRCGIYASKDLELAGSYFQGQGLTPWKPLCRVIGEVTLWGTVIECEQGYRASHAYPLRLYVPVDPVHRSRRIEPEEIAYELEAYGIPVERAEIQVAEHAA